MVNEVNMSIELKKPITSLSELNCNNCISYQRFGKRYFCNNPVSDEWDRMTHDCCSLGMWFVTIKHNSGDEVELSESFGLNTLPLGMALFFRFTKRNFSWTFVLNHSRCIKHEKNLSI
jgi:hypothetical protein